MSKLVQTYVKNMPPYYELITEEHIENPEETKLRIINRINNYNGGNNESI